MKERDDVMKYGNEHFYEAPRIFWPVKYVKEYNSKKHENVFKTDASDKYAKYHELSVYAKWLYQTLKEYEHRHTGKNNNEITVIYEGVENDKNWFYIGNDKLSYVSGISRSQVERAKKELLAVGLIKTCRVHFIRNGKKTKTYVSGYYILGETELKWQKYRKEDD